MKDPNETVEKQLEEGRASLEAMLETLKPFLPRHDQRTPEPARDWHLTRPEQHQQKGAQPATFVRPF